MAILTNATWNTFYSAAIVEVFPAPLILGVVKRRQTRYKLFMTSDPDCRALVGVQLPTALRAPGLCPVLEELILGYLLSVRVRPNDDY